MKLWSCAIAAIYPLFANAQTDVGNQTLADNVVVERVGNYRTREERREAGLGTELTDWLTFSGLVEVEHIREVSEFDGGLSDYYDYETDPAVQAAFDVSLFDIFEMELIFEYAEDDEPIMDELIMGTDIGDWGLSLGRFYAPFGIYYSHFINGPMLEFAETRRDMIQLDYDFNDKIEWALFVFDGKTKQFGKDSEQAGWGTIVDAFFMSGRLNVGGGYISNLAESDEKFLKEENNIFRNRVGAWNAYVIYEANHWDMSFEWLEATGNFYEFETVEDKPESWNFEAGYFPTNKIEIAARYERSKELIDAPQEQYGLALTWRISNRLSMTAEYLWANYKKGFVEEDDEVFFRRGNTAALWLAIEF